MKNSTYDLVVIGGGINGTAIALEATGRGLKTLLCEKGDLASGTSSASTKLIHGGLRYLAALEFSLVIESLNDRKNLTECAPHLVKPLSFCIPFKHKNFNYWQTKLGLAFYNHFAKLPVSASSPAIAIPNHDALDKNFNHYLCFQDCYTDDARLVIANAKKARELGADLKTYTELIRVEEHTKHWDLTFKNQLGGDEQETITTKTVINAAGSWVEYLHTQLFHCLTEYKLKLIQGSHLLVPKLTEGNQAYLFPTRDNRVIFMIPYLDQFSLIGTTDVDVTETFATTKAFNLTSDETNYILTEINFYLSKKITAEQIVAHWTGARALPILASEHGTNPSKISREFKLELVQKNPNGPYLLSVWGGKLTTHRSLAVKALNLLAPKLDLKQDAFIYTQYLNAPHNHLVDLNKLFSNYDFVPDNIKKRWIFCYGVECLDFLFGCQSLADLGEHFGHGLYEAEIKYLKEKEWAMTVDDILYRRTKLGYFFSDEEKKALQDFFEQ